MVYIVIFYLCVCAVFHLIDKYSKKKVTIKEFFEFRRIKVVLTILTFVLIYVLYILAIKTNSFGDILFGFISVLIWPAFVVLAFSFLSQLLIDDGVLLLVGIVLEILYIYTISCVLVWVYNTVRKKK